MTISAYDYDFTENDYGWKADFAGHPVNDTYGSELYGAYTDAVPESSTLTSRSFKLSGKNVGSDLFMFVKRKVGGLLPNTHYTVTFHVDLASSVDAGDEGSVYLKAGASPLEPECVADNGFYRLNLDKGDHGQSGDDLVLLGDILPTTKTKEYALLSRNNTMAQSRYLARTDSQGEIWLIVGADSNRKRTTTVFLKRIRVIFSAS